MVIKKNNTRNPFVYLAVVVDVVLVGDDNTLIFVFEITLSLFERGRVQHDTKTGGVCDNFFYSILLQNTYSSKTLNTII